MRNILVLLTTLLLLGCFNASANSGSESDNSTLSKLEELDVFGTNLLNQNKLHEGLEARFKLLEMSEQFPDYKIHALENIADIYYHLSQFDEARKFYTKAIDVSEIAGLHNHQRTQNRKLANVYRELHQTDKSEALFLKNISNHKNKDSKLQLATDYHNLGNLYHSLVKLNKARESYENGLKYYKEINDESGVASLCHNLAMIDAKEGDTASAEKNYLDSAKLNKKINYPHRLALNYTGLAKLYLKQKKLDEAENYSKQALDIYFNYEDKPAIASEYMTIGLILREKGLKSESNKSLQSARKRFVELNNETQVSNIDRIIGEQ